VKDDRDGPLTAPRAWFTPENVAACIAPLKAIHHRLAGPEAALSSIPLAAMRAIFGDDFTVRIRRKPFTVNLHDTIVSFEIMVYKAWQPLETSLYERLVRPGDRVIDVGANIGYFTALFAELVGDEGSVLAIEPEPNNIRLLRKNVAARGLADIVTVAETAVGASAGSANLYTAASGNTFLDFCQDYRTCPFTSVIFAADKANFGDVASLQGKPVEIHGDVVSFRGRAEIILHESSQVRSAE